MKPSEPPNPPPTPERSTRDRILGAAFEVFTQHGYAGASTLEIATRAKVSKRDLYANFGSKHEMLVGCITSRAMRMRLPADLPAPRDRAALASILTACGTTILREVSHPTVMAMYRLAIAEAARSPEAGETLNASRARNRDALEAVLAQAQAQGILGEGEPSRMMEQFFALLWGDLILSLLFGVVGAPEAAEIDARALDATDAFLKLHALPTAP